MRTVSTRRPARNHHVPEGQPNGRHPGTVLGGFGQSRGSDVIIKCRLCTGHGSVRHLFEFESKPCPACRGAGEIDLQIPKDKLAACKFCGGRGVVQDSPLVHEVRVCPTCKGVGMLERPRIGYSDGALTEPLPQIVPRPTQFEYDVAISFAGEDRATVAPYASELQRREVRVFFADFEQVSLWGVDLYETFDTIYRLKARFCVLFLSSHYAEKVWTNHERRAAQARAVTENREYILPVRLDRTGIPGIRPTIGYLDWQHMGMNALVEATIKKISKI
jgi:hypothetical protein